MAQQQASTNNGYFNEQRCENRHKSIWRALSWSAAVTLTICGWLAYQGWSVSCDSKAALIEVEAQKRETKVYRDGLEKSVENMSKAISRIDRKLDRALGIPDRGGGGE